MILKTIIQNNITEICNIFANFVPLGLGVRSVKITWIRMSYLEMGIRWWSRVPWCWCRNHLSGSESEAAAAGRRRRRRPTPPSSPPRMAAPLKFDRPSRHWPRPPPGGAPPTISNNGSDSASAHDVRGRVCKSTSLLSTRRFFSTTLLLIVSARGGSGGVSVYVWIIARFEFIIYVMCVFLCYRRQPKAKRATAIKCICMCWTRSTERHRILFGARTLMGVKYVNGAQIMHTLF